jgi:folylpolyglutamate synthase/dihydropteroate synthase
LAQAFARYCRVSIASSPLRGLEAVLDAASEDDALLVAGSLFLVGEILPYFLGRHGHAGLFSTSSPALYP